jgi:hypothetical protein
MKKVLFVFLFCAVSAVAGYSQTVRRMGNVTIGKPYHGCVSTIYRSDSLFTFVVMSSGKPATIGFRLSDTPEGSIAVLEEIIGSYKVGETFWFQDYKLLCIKDKGFAVVEARADKQLPSDGGYWLSIKNMKKDIKCLRKLDHEKPSLRDRLLIRKLKRQLEGH